MLGIAEGTPLACAAVTANTNSEGTLAWVAVADHVRDRGLERILMYGACRALRLTRLHLDAPNELHDFFARCEFIADDTGDRLVLAV